MRTLNALVNTKLTFLIRITDVVNGIHCIKGAKVRRFYIYKFINNLSIAKINLLFCLFAYVYSFITAFKTSRTSERKKKSASMGDEYSHNFTN